MLFQFQFIRLGRISNVDHRYWSWKNVYLHGQSYEGCSQSFANRYTENTQSIGIWFNL